MDICSRCGICCTAVSIVRVTSSDIQRLMQGYGLTSEQAHGMMRRHEGELRVVMDSGACPALSSKDGQYRCNIYEHRPATCQEYECYILTFAKASMRQMANGEVVDRGNPFCGARDESGLERQVLEAIQAMRAVVRCP